MSAVIQRVSAMSEVRSRRNGVAEEVHALLTMWGNWHRSSKNGPSGYPRESPFMKAALYGELGIPQQSNVQAGEGSMPNLVEWIDRIVESDTITEDHKRVLYARYRTSLPPSRGLSNTELMAKDCSMSVSTFRSRLEAARSFVWGKMYP